MTTGTDLLGEGTEVPLRGGKTAYLVFDMYSFVKIEEEFGGLDQLQKALPSGEIDAKQMPKDMFSKVMKLFHYGFNHEGWSFEEMCHKLLPKHFPQYIDALGKELNFGDGKADADPKP